MFARWSSVFGVVLAVGGLAQADNDAVKLGRFKPDPNGFGALVKTANAVEGTDKPGTDDTELAFHGRRRFWNGFSAGYTAGYWGRGWGGYYHRPYYVTSYYTPYVYTYSYPVVTYSSYYYGGWGGGAGWCGISGTATPTTVPPRSIEVKPAEPVPPVTPATPMTNPIPMSKDDPTAIPVSLPGAKKPSYQYPAYGKK